MKKIITLLAATGLVAALGTSAQAQTATVTAGSASNPALCMIKGTAIGTLTKIGVPPTEVKTNVDSDAAIFQVACNTGSSTLTISPATTTTIPTNTNLTIGYIDGSGVYAAASDTSPIVTASGITSAIGDQVRIKTSVVSTTAGALLPTGTYKVNILLSVAP